MNGKRMDIGITWLFAFGLRYFAIKGIREA